MFPNVRFITSEEKEALAGDRALLLSWAGAGPPVGESLAPPAYSPLRNFDWTLEAGR